MRFYEFTDHSPYEKEWTIAISIHPHSPIVKWACPACRRADQYPSGAFGVTVEGGNAFPDLLGCGAYPLLILSERMISVLQDAGIDCFKKYPVSIESIRESSVQRQDAPNYFRVEITGECKIDFFASGMTITNICAHCGRIDVEPLMIPRFAILQGSWDGCDLFRDQRYFPRVTFCTERLVDLVKENGLTNCEFIPMC